MQVFSGQADRRAFLGGWHDSFVPTLQQILIQTLSLTVGREFRRHLAHLPLHDNPYWGWSGVCEFLVLVNS